MEISTPILETCGLTHAFEGGTAGVFDVSVRIQPGEFILLAGHNGCGKTTLIRLLMGLIRPQAGRILLEGRDIFKDLTRTRQALGLIFQNADTQILGETVYADAAFGPENLCLPPEEIRSRVTRVLEETDLLALKDRHPATLSGGEKRRLTIAGVLAMAPQVLLMDEPFANLDYPSACALAGRIKGLHDTGKTIIMATHDMDHVLTYASRILVMDRGRIKAFGRPSEIAPRLSEFGMRPWCPSCQPFEGAHP